MNAIERRLAAIAAATLLLAGSSHAQDAQTLRTRSLAATCAQCHETEGRAVTMPALPPLAGMPAATLIEQMTALKSGARPGTVMPQIAKGFSDAQIVQLANYFATVTPKAAPRP